MVILVVAQGSSILEMRCLTAVESKKKQEAVNRITLLQGVTTLPQATLCECVYQHGHPCVCVTLVWCYKGCTQGPFP